MHRFILSCCSLNPWFLHSKTDKFWSILLLGSVIKHKPLISEEWSAIQNVLYIYRKCGFGVACCRIFFLNSLMCVVVSRKISCFAVQSRGKCNFFKHASQKKKCFRLLKLKKNSFFKTTSITAKFLLKLQQPSRSFAFNFFYERKYFLETFKFIYHK